MTSSLTPKDFCPEKERVAASLTKRKIQRKGQALLLLGNMKLTLEVLSKVRLAVVRLAVVRLPPSYAIPEWILSADTNTSFLSITRTRDELSLVCPEHIVPTVEQKVEREWIAIKVQGPLDFAWTGILAGLAQPLATAGISIFAISTYDTDYILVKKGVKEQATKVLHELGHVVIDSNEDR